MTTGRAEYLRVTRLEKNWLTTSRVEALSDGIFAIAMTILVLDLVVPDAPSVDPDAALRAFLREDWHKLLNYAKGFLLLGVFWIIHHKQFHYIKRTDEGFIWINLLALMTIVLIPFSTSVEGEYSQVQLAALIFNVNILVIGLAYLLLWYYATYRYRLVSREEFSQERMRISRLRSLVMPGVAMVAIVLTFVSPSWSSVAYLLIPLILRQL